MRFTNSEYWVYRIKRMPVFLFMLYTYNCFAQNDTISLLSGHSSNLKFSCNSSFVNPGLGIGVEVPVKLVKKIKSKRSGNQKVLFKDRFVSGNIRWYHQPAFHDNVYATIEGVLRRTSAKGFFMEFSPGVGYSRTFLGGTTYTVDDNGNVSVKRFAGYNYALLFMSAGIGFDFSKGNSIPVSVFSEFSLINMFPYNSTVYIRPAIELGIIYHPRKLLMVKPKVKSVVGY